ncbi:hypothetical protein FHS29_000450 [Saccharothrix tamanrassetensis]|uniref:Acyl-CoA carboxylase epsilon subunit-like protein n=1 Tax=Saccharothrix tamanrassetensis TaxID=1051531 RepID=A0A841CA83_9PSEU|nr:acyl-CoA carboxylase epsilon subunit [Saccharothrix tamanrassetensis]MBB5953880.1 hypothetical protein [Saccharothrix tamanrassetensis]
MTPSEVVAVAGNPTPEELAVVLVVVRALSAPGAGKPVRDSGTPARDGWSRVGGLRGPLNRGPWRRGTRL